jgi:acyl dehydratase
MPVMDVSIGGMKMISTRPTTTLKTEQGHTIQIRESYTNSTREAINLYFEVEGDKFGIVLSAEDSRELAITLKLIAERILQERPNDR